jgi:copper chaperone
MHTRSYPVTGLTCAHCVAAVTTELGAIAAVTDVQVDLQPGATSTVTVTSQTPLLDQDVIDALDEAGDYALAS